MLLLLVLLLFWSGFSLEEFKWSSLSLRLSYLHPLLDLAIAAKKLLSFPLVFSDT